ncbi:hypothetical protein R80B4_01592 [Fibrobacteres bacterium R8-0-B4]
MPSISLSPDSFLRKVGGGAAVGGANDRSDRKAVGGVGGKRLSADEYIASLPAQAAFIGGRTLETLKSLPQTPKPKEQGVGIGINNIGRTTGFNAIGGTGIGVNTLGGGGIGVDKSGGTGIGTVGIGNINTANNAIGVVAEPYKKAINTDEVEETDETDEKDEAEAEDKTENGADTDKSGGVAELTPEEQAAVNELRTVDREVRAHEQAHIAAGGAYIRGGASYQYQRGPDNKSYAVGGEVSIDTAPERDDPGATITKMQTVRAAALAPGDPSAQDRAVAAAAAGRESLARAELAEQRRNGGEAAQ